MIMRIKHAENDFEITIPTVDIDVTYFTNCTFCERRIEFDEQQYHDFCSKYGYYNELWFCTASCAEKANIRSDYVTSSGCTKIIPSFGKIGDFICVVDS